MKSKKILLTGNTLKIEDIFTLVNNSKATVEVSNAALTRARKSRKFLEEEAERKIIYGVNTGFGPMASYIIGKQYIDSLQRNLILGHATGMGDPISEDFVLAAMVVRLNTLLKGYSGVSPELIEQLKLLINNRIIPIIPEHGAVGTSGDLTQLAHIGLSIIGEGDVMYKGRRVSTKKVFKKLGIKNYKLKSKEGLSLINGTSTMAGIASLLCMDANRLISISTRTGAMAMELAGGMSDCISSRLHNMRPHPGQGAVAKMLRNILKTSQLLRTRRLFERHIELNNSIHRIDSEVQEVYSLRCIPQILGPVLDTLNKTKKEVDTEINSVTDNPIVDYLNKNFLHGGNFHGDYVAAAVDQLKMTLVKLTILSERRVNFFLNDKINKDITPFLNLKTPGYSIGLQGLQFVATSTTAQSQTYAFPQYVHSISTNADNQDVVSMGTDAALLTAKVVENAYIVLAIELITLTQAVDLFNNYKKLSEPSQQLYKIIRKDMPKILNDRVVVDQLDNLLSSIKEMHDLDIKWPS